MIRSTHVTILLMFLLLTGVYFFHAAPTITTGDSAELAAVGGTLGIAHSPGYPLYSILSRLGCELIPWGGTAYRTNVLSALWSAAAIAVILLSVSIQTNSPAALILIGLVCGMVPLWMQQAVVTEVFALNSFLAAVILYVVLQNVTITRACFCAYLLGLGLGNNHTLLLLSPALVILFWPVWRERPLHNTLLLMGFMFLGLSIYLFIPLRAHRLPLMDWEEPTSWERFWKLFTRARYGSLQLAQGTLPPITWEDVDQQVKYISQTLWTHYGLWSLALGLGLWSGWKTAHRRLTLALLMAFLTTGVIFLVWTHLTVTSRTRYILDRFLYLPLVPFNLFLGMGFVFLLDRLKRFHIDEVAVISLLGLGTLIGMKAWPLPSQRQNYYVRDLGRDLLRNAPPQALLFADRADEAEFSLAYLQRVENRRPDVQFIDCNAGVSLSIYGPQYYDVWGRPRLATRTLEERRRIAAWNGPVYYATHEPQMIPIERVQEGLLYRVPGLGLKRRNLPWEQLLVFRQHSPLDSDHQGWDRGMYADYLYLLAQDALLSRDNARASFLFRGSDLYARS
jgi:hypothetical protein